MQALRAAIVAIPLILISADVRGQELPRIEVSFHLVEPTYRAAFAQEPEDPGGVSQLEEFEADAARAIETALKRFGFLRSGPGPDAHSLDVTIVRKESTNPEIERNETFFLVSLDQSEPLEWEFRPWEEYDLAVIPGRFHEEVGQRFGARLDDHRETFIATRLSEISLADQVYMGTAAGRSFCVFPFSFDELEADRHTIFILETKPDGVLFPMYHWAIASEVAAADVPDIDPSFANGIVAVETSSQMEEEKPHTPLPAVAPPTPSVMAVTGLFVFRYIHRPPVEVEETSPAALLEDPSP